MSANRRTAFRPGLDNLDGRILLSATYSLTKGNLYENVAGQSTLLASNVNSFQVTSSDAVVYLEQNGNLFEKPASGNAQLLDRLVNSFQVVSATQVNVVDWFDRELSNAGICNLTRADFTRDDSITYSDMLGIFNEVLQSGPVTIAEVQNLQTVVANPTTLNMPGYVQNLASKVVNPTSADVSYLEWYYSDGPSMPMLQGLVNQWFLGSVQPVAVNSDEGSPAEDPYNVYTDAGATGYTLFGPNGPTFTDVAQGSAGDCWFLASLAETAARDPKLIQNMFINNGNGTWTVRFYVNGAPDYVTVDDQLPIATADPSYNGGYAFDAPQNGILWVALAEKAFAEENLSGRVTTSQPGVDSYAALNSGQPSWALPAITGLSSSEFNVTPGVTSQQIAAALQAGDLVCIGTPNSSDIDPYLVPGHCYAIVGYNPSSSMPFEVFNPWGVNSLADGVWEAFISNGAFLEENFASWGVVGTAASGSGSRDAMLSADSPASDRIKNADELAVLLAANSSQQARPGTVAAVPTNAANASTRQPIVIGLAPTSRPGQLRSIGRRHDYQALALGSLMDEDLEFLRV